MMDHKRRRPRVLVLSMYYRPEPNFITGDVVDALAAEADVTVLTALPSYPTGKIYAGFPSMRPLRTREGDVTIWRIPHVIDRSTSPIRRAISYLSFAVVASLLAPFLGRPDVIWVYHTPFTTAVAALPVRWMRRSRLVYTIADLWPESFIASGIMRPGCVFDALYAYSTWIVRQADEIVCSTRGTLERYAREGVPRNRLHYVPVWTDGTTVARSECSVDARNIVYAGNLGPAQSLESLVLAAAQLQREGLDVTVDIYGTGAAETKIKDLARSTGATNVVFHGRVTASEAFAASQRAMAQVVSLRKSQVFERTVPSKLFAAMAAGTPILAGLQGEPLQDALASGGAFAYNTDDPRSLAEAIRRLVRLTAEERAAISRALQQHYENHYAHGKLVGRYRAILLRGHSSTTRTAYGL